LFEGWAGARTLVIAYAAAEFASYSIGKGLGLFLFLAWNMLSGPSVAVLVTVMTIRAAFLASTTVRRLVILSSISVPVGIILLTVYTIAGGRGLVRFLGLE
jgi:hypothetical protein